MHNESKAEKFIVFTVADYHLALPISEVVHVASRPATDDDLSKAGLVQIGRHLIQLLDLHQQLEPGTRSHKSQHSPFLVITHSYSLPGQLFAIPVSEPPNLVEFPLERLRLLPQSNGQSAVLNIASYAATIDQDEVNATIFLVDVKRMVIPIASVC